MAAGPATTLREPLTKLLLTAACLHATSGCGQQAALSCCSNTAAACAIAEAAEAADVVKGAFSTWLNYASGGAAVAAPISVSQPMGFLHETGSAGRVRPLLVLFQQGRPAGLAVPHRLPASLEMLPIAARPTASRRLLCQANDAAHVAPADGARA